MSWPRTLPENVGSAIVHVRPSSTACCVCPAKLYPAACAAAKGSGLPVHDVSGGGLSSLGRSLSSIGVGLGGLVTTRIISVESSLGDLISNKLDENSSSWADTLSVNNWTLG